MRKKRGKDYREHRDSGGDNKRGGGRGKRSSKEKVIKKRVENKEAEEMERIEKIEGAKNIGEEKMVKKSKNYRKEVKQLLVEYLEIFFLRLQVTS